MTAYDVTVTREDNLWVAVIAELSPGATDVEHFADLDVEVRDVISLLTDTDPDDFAINWHYEIDGVDVTEELHRALALEEELRAVQRARDEARLRAVTALVRAGVSQRAIGDALNISHQRVHQLIHG
jgi:hypothetical protein